MSRNEHRFYILRGYFENGKYHSQGGKGLPNFLIFSKLGFKNRKEFIEWYNSLTPEEIKNGKKAWCPGHCCQSILWRLLGISDPNQSPS